MSDPVPPSHGAKGKELFLDTKGACFLCLEERKGNVEVCLRNICRFLNIDPCSILLKSLKESLFATAEKEDDEMGSSHSTEKCDFSVMLCQACSRLVKSFSELIRKMEIMSMLVNYETQTIHNILLTSEQKSSGRWEDLKKKMRSDCGNPVEVRVVENLRQRTRDKCYQKVKRAMLTSMPKVHLNVLKTSNVERKPLTESGNNLQVKKSSVPTVVAVDANLSTAEDSHIINSIPSKSPIDIIPPMRSSSEEGHITSIDSSQPPTIVQIDSPPPPEIDENTASPITASIPTPGNSSETESTQYAFVQNEFPENDTRMVDYESNESPKSESAQEAVVPNDSVSDALQASHYDEIPFEIIFLPTVNLNYDDGPIAIPISRAHVPRSSDSCGNTGATIIFSNDQSELNEGSSSSQCPRKNFPGHFTMLEDERRAETGSQNHNVLISLETMPPSPAPVGDLDTSNPPTQPVVNMSHDPPEETIASCRPITFLVPTGHVQQQIEHPGYINNGNNLASYNNNVRVDRVNSDLAEKDTPSHRNWFNGILAHMTKIIVSAKNASNIRYMCLVCHRKFCNIKIRYHLVNLHPEQFFVESRPPHLSGAEYKDLCRNLLVTEESKAVRMHAKPKSGGKRRKEPELVCPFCHLNFPRLTFRYHLVSDHQSILQQRLHRYPRKMRASNRRKTDPSLPPGYSSSYKKRKVTQGERGTSDLAGSGDSNEVSSEIALARNSEQPLAISMDFDCHHRQQNNTSVSNWEEGPDAVREDDDQFCEIIEMNEQQHPANTTTTPITSEREGGFDKSMLDEKDSNSDPAGGQIEDEFNGQDLDAIMSPIELLSTTLKTLGVVS